MTELIEEFVTVAEPGGESAGSGARLQSILTIRRREAPGSRREGLQRPAGTAGSRRRSAGMI